MNEQAAPSQPAVEAPRPQRQPRPIWPVTVVSTSTVTPAMRRVRLTGDCLADFTEEAGHEVVLYFERSEEKTTRRHYSIRNIDPQARTVDVDFVLHGDGPGATWATKVEPGTIVEISGPIERHHLNLEADWQLFAGDETALPAIFAMVEDLAPGTKTYIFLEVANESEKQPLATKADVELTWLTRDGAQHETSRLIIDAVLSRELPAGRGHAFLAGETGLMRELRAALLARGLEREQIFAMGYWRPGRFGGDETIRD